jgi:hypothetical protein
MGLFRKFARANSIATLPPIEWPFKKKGGGGDSDIRKKSSALAHSPYEERREYSFF